MLVEHVKGIPGELGATAGVAVDQERVLVACSEEIRDELSSASQDKKTQNFQCKNPRGPNVRVICQTRSLEMFVAIVMKVLEYGKIEIAILSLALKLCVSRMPRLRARSAR